MQHSSHPQHIPVRIEKVLGGNQFRPQTGVPAASEPEARLRMEEFCEKWGTPYPAIRRLWETAWPKFVPFLDYDVEIRRG